MKIARWNDINYYAVKQTVEKTHKTLHKNMKTFETILQRPVCSLLTEDTKLDWSTRSLTESGVEVGQALDISCYVEALQVNMLPNLLNYLIVNKIYINVC